MRGAINLLVLVIWLCSSNTDAVECESGWTLYKDEACIKIFDTLVVYEEAKVFCASQSNGASTSTLVMVKEPALQEFLASYTQNVYESLWLGGKYDKESNQFQWEDGAPLTYTNWAEGYPRNITDEDVCIQLRPIKAKTEPDLEGKWEDAVCQKRGLAMCQRTVTWAMEDAVKEIIKLRKQLEHADIDRADLRNQFEVVNSKVVPVGSIYVEYFNQPDPTTLWPNLEWQDITASYAGMFFRALGNGSEEWGKTQAGCAPRISEMHYITINPEDPFREPLTIPYNGWSEQGKIGWHGGTSRIETVRFHTAGCEVRPKNQAVRIWKRLA